MVTTCTEKERGCSDENMEVSGYGKIQDEN